MKNNQFDRLNKKFETKFRLNREYIHNILLHYVEFDGDTVPASYLVTIFLICRTPLSFTVIGVHYHIIHTFFLSFM